MHNKIIQFYTSRINFIHVNKAGSILYVFATWLQFSYRKRFTKGKNSFCISSVSPWSKPSGNV